jgi:hypothetical protein
MTHPTNATLWIGEELEYDDGQGTKMFVDGASADSIRVALDEYPDVKELYFAHEFDWHVVREFENQIRITVEVADLSDVPSDLRGRVNVILRVPNWVSRVKMRDGSQIQVVEMEPDMNPTAVWHGQKAYPEDEVIK